MNKPVAQITAYFGRQEPMFALYIVFIASQFLSGTAMFIIPFASQHFNVSPANVLVGIALVFSVTRSYRILNTKTNGTTRLASLRTSVVDGLAVPKSVLPLLLLGLALWTLMLTSLVKDLPFVGTQSILTGAAGIGSLWFTLKSIRNLNQLGQVVILFAVITTIYSALTILVSSDLLPIRSLSIVSVPTTAAPDQFESFLPFFDRDIVFGFSSDTLGANILISISSLIVLMIKFKQSPRTKILMGAAILVMVFTAFVTQSRGLWISVPIYAALLTVLILTRGRFNRLRPYALLLLTVLVVLAFWTVINIVGGPKENGEELSRFYNENRPTVFGRDVPREFVFNAAIRLNYFSEAGQVLVSRPLTGARIGDLGNHNSHSTYADIVMIAGIAPLIVLIAIVWFVFRRIGISKPLPYPWFEVSVSLTIALLLTNLFYFGIFQKQFLITLGVITLLPLLMFESTADPDAAAVADEGA